MMNLYTIVVTYNGEQWIEACIESLVSSRLTTEIVVVDNASTDGTVAQIASRFPDVKVLAQPENLGFGKANNIGISYALGQGADYVFLLNQDARVGPDTLEQLVEGFKREPLYGVLSPVQCTWKGDALEYYFSQFMMANPLFYSDYVLKKAALAVYEVPFVNAASWLLPRQVLERVGGFDPIFKHYGEDNNYCQRIAYHGFKVGVVPDAYVYHDARVRNMPKDYLFSDVYWHHEVKNLQVRYANINSTYSKKDFRLVKQRLVRLILIQVLQLNLRKAWGYLKKYRIFEKAFGSIEASRKRNSQSGSHYLNC
ncbi:glycosyltransferase family 2 protein [Snuella lapsa]|uniref:Glycosyltransferase 2-like domain-containing protein n=1 Tax=Snuella lapsa TaxID=870481 RepID=A0ABP6XSH5_9FLAO